MNNTNGEKLWTREFIGISLSNTLIYIAQYAMIAALPIVIMTEYGGGDVEAGLAMTFFQIGTVVARPCAGILIDALNKRWLMLAVTTAFFLLMWAFAFASTISAIYGLRLVHGIVFAIATTTAAALAALILPPRCFSVRDSAQSPQHCRRSPYAVPPLRVRVSQQRRISGHSTSALDLPLPDLASSLSPAATRSPTASPMLRSSRSVRFATRCGAEW